MIEANDIVFQICKDPLEDFYLQPLIVQAVNGRKLVVLKPEDEDLLELHREDIIADHKEALQVMVELIQMSIKESQQKTKELKELLKETNAELKNLKQLLTSYSRS